MFDNWIWLNSQSEFQQQCRNVNEGLVGGKEHYVVIVRQFWTVTMAMLICLGAIQKGVTIFRDFLFLTKWGLWFTFFTFLIGMFATTPLPDNSQILLKKYRNDPFHAWKWFTILFQISLTMEILITILYWTALHENTYSPDFPSVKKAMMIMDHSVPLVALLTEFFMSNQPFVKRHIWVSGFVGVLYGLVNFVATVSGYPPYSIVSYDSFWGVILSLCNGLFFFLIAFALVWLSKRKLSKSKNCQVMSTLLEKKYFDPIQSFKYSQGNSQSNRESGASGQQPMKGNVVIDNTNQFVNHDPTNYSRNTIKLDEDAS